jgi:hypothetical protein
MTLTHFIVSLTQPQPPAGINIYLQALWFDGKDNWEQAHTLIQDNTDSNSSWIHAYLHRKEGDTGNADYWYRKAGRVRPNVPLKQEWEMIAEEMLQKPV